MTKATTDTTKARRARAHAWEVKAAERANEIGKKIRRVEHDGGPATIKRGRVLAPMARAVASLLASMARCERVAERHEAAAAGLST